MDHLHRFQRRERFCCIWLKKIFCGREVGKRQYGNADTEQVSAVDLLLVVNLISPGFDYPDATNWWHWNRAIA